MEHIVLHGIECPGKLTSFRTAKLPAWVIDQLEDIKNGCEQAAEVDNEDEAAEDATLGTTFEANETRSVAGVKVLLFIAACLHACSAHVECRRLQR